MRMSTFLKMLPSRFIGARSALKGSLYAALGCLSVFACPACTCVIEHSPDWSGDDPVIQEIETLERDHASPDFASQQVHRTPLVSTIDRPDDRDVLRIANLSIVDGDIPSAKVLRKMHHVVYWKVSTNWKGVFVCGLAWESEQSKPIKFTAMIYGR